MILSLQASIRKSYVYLASADFPARLSVVRLRIPELLEELQWTPYRLAKELGVTEPAVYRLVKRRGHFDRLSGALLDRLCVVTGKTPGELIEWSPARLRRRP
jgi:DNA-binding Xre family transcriptional regulator